ncbi:class I SAM-dependent methyltransferase [Terribacillus saccharophilus]|uniref:SAM-dependent methyltransferase n=1 Tax=Terribacillus saccharophilus TaxID=361277 RepID=A0ABX4H155_9BACI|nr:methyltransferase domain-containing protein [Terribacillus saccharophilus]PAD36456.1 SAM-dependent methyltransferase [Terribacillus saccharophilus]PAD97120.1 SAM-dependent methyltransferase [Terribacillus saccharophilus]PAE00868.1 SAM-dependent methyltransferase [Terribacillus saccharophilus]
MNPKLQKKISNLENIERFPADKLFEFLPIKKDDNVLDLGAGTGYISLAIAERVNTVYAFDYDEDILNYLDTAAKGKGIENIKTIAGNFKDITLDSHTIDIAIASIALHEVQPLSTALKEINRILKDKGLFLCIELEKTENSSGPRVSANDMESQILRAGFSIVDKIYPSTKIANQSVYIILAQKNK